MRRGGGGIIQIEKEGMHRYRLAKPSELLDPTTIVSNKQLR